jgi:hypothetical protein
MPRNALLFILATVLPALCVDANAQPQRTAADAMDQIVTRLYATMTPEELTAITIETAETLITPEERDVLATGHWVFEANVPVVVSVMRSTRQKTAPFWLPERQFEKTELVVTNAEGWKYEVWQKPFPAGTVGLGINGFDNHLPHYLVAVGPQNPTDNLTLSGFHPSNQTVLTMEPGSLTYHDWTELVLDEVPESLQGQQLLTTIRGRSREASLASGFRNTPFPSTLEPSSIHLTWSEDPRTTQNVQWRAVPDVTQGVVRFRESASDKPLQTTEAAVTVMNDRMLVNDPECHWFNAEITGLRPDTIYDYQVAHPQHDTQSEWLTFRTAPDGHRPFRILHISDTQEPEGTREAFEQMTKTGFEADFLLNSGDLVDVGNERQDWDMLLEYGEPWLSRIPMMPCIGNHDARLGLGAELYLTIFDLPDNGAKEIPQDASYTFRYGNTEFFVLDVMSDLEPQTRWLANVLPKSDATWKIAMLHFPPFLIEGYMTRIEEDWGSLFQQYGVDLVLTGHVHYYARSYPIRDGKPADDGRGPIYVTSVTIPSGDFERVPPRNIAKMFGGGRIVNVIDVDEDRLHWESRTTSGEVKDEFTLSK